MADTTTETSTAIVPLADVRAMAQAVVSSKLFGVQTESQALALMLLCQSEGCHPMAAVQRFHIIQGRPAMRSDALLAAFQSRGGKVEWRERSDTAAEAIFYSSGCLKGLPVRWTMEDAARAGIGKKDNWKAYPRQMLSARVVAEGVRAVDPGALNGLYTDAEVQDFGGTGVGFSSDPINVAASVSDAQTQDQATNPSAQANQVHTKTTASTSPGWNQRDGCITQAQAKKMFAACGQYDVPTAELKGWLASRGWEHSSEIPSAEFDGILDSITNWHTAPDKAQEQGE